MTFIVTLITLLVERFFDWSHLRQVTPFYAYDNWVENKMLNKNNYLTLAAVIVPILLAILIIELAINDVMYGFIKLIFEVIVLLYCYGPNNLWADAFSSINMLSSGDATAASSKLQLSFGISKESNAKRKHTLLLEHLFIAANRRLFAVVFWFVLGGIVGAVLYRLITLIADGNTRLSVIAHQIEDYMDYIPVRIFTFLFALGGHFSKVLAIWRKKAFLGVSFNDTLLTECGFAALGVEPGASLADDSAVEREAVGLLDRVFVISLVLIAVVVLVL